MRARDLLSPAHDSDTHVRSAEFFCHSRASAWRARGIPNSAGGRGEGPGFFARQPRARMTEPELEQDRNCHDDLQSLDKIAGEEVRNEASIYAGVLRAEGEPFRFSEDFAPFYARFARRIPRSSERRDSPRGTRRMTELGFARGVRKSLGMTERGLRSASLVSEKDRDSPRGTRRMTAYPYN